MLSYTATLKIGTQPDVVTVEDLKSHLNITHTYQDTLIQAYRDAAISQAENYTSRSLKINEVTVKTDAFTQNLQLENTPFKGALVIQYYDANNAIQTLEASKYSLEYYYNEPTIVFTDFDNIPDVYDRFDAVLLTYETGYDEALVPEPFKTFVRLCVGFFYEHREDSVDKLPRLMYAVIRPYKKWD